MYVFYDTDMYYGHEEYDIRGEAYKTLMRTCCQFSSVLSLKFMHPNIAAISKLHPFEIRKPDNIPENEALQNCYWDIRYYRACPALCDILISIADGIFEWLHGWGFKNPDDPIFYRSDGSVFFGSEIHEGVCVFNPKYGENVDDLLACVDWLTDDPRTAGPNLLRHLTKGQ